MEITVELFLWLVALAFACEWIDASLGMGYGTILSPTLLIMGFEPVVAVPAVLMSQAVGGLSASVFHHRFENVRFSPGSRDLDMVGLVVGFGLAATVVAAFVSVGLPAVAVKTYIGVLVLVMGALILTHRGFEFSWSRMVVVSVVSAFNKGISGGGFGPVVTGGQVLSGQDHRRAVGVTTLSEAPICLAGFLAYLIARTSRDLGGSVLDQPVGHFLSVMFSSRMLQWELLLALLLGSVLVTPFAAWTTRVLPRVTLRYAIGGLITVLGVWTLWHTWG